MPEPWTDAEILVAIESYLMMLLLETERASFVKTDYRREAEVLIPNRSAKSIEFKWCNISAVLDESHLPWIEGFKPLPNYQRRLQELVGTWLLDHSMLRKRLETRAAPPPSSS